MRGLPCVVSVSRNIKATPGDLRVAALLKRLRDRTLITSRFKEVKHGEPIQQEIDLTMVGIELLKRVRP